MFDALLEGLRARAKRQQNDFRETLKEIGQLPSYSKQAQRLYHNTLLELANDAKEHIGIPQSEAYARLIRETERNPEFEKALRTVTETTLGLFG